MALRHGFFPRAQTLTSSSSSSVESDSDTVMSDDEPFDSLSSSASASMSGDPIYGMATVVDERSDDTVSYDSYDEADSDNDMSTALSPEQARCFFFPWEERFSNFTKLNTLPNIGPYQWLVRESNPHITPGMLTVEAIGVESVDEDAVGVRTLRRIVSNNIDYSHSISRPVVKFRCAYVADQERWVIAMSRNIEMLRRRMTPITRINWEQHQAKLAVLPSFLNEVQLAEDKHLTPARLVALRQATVQQHPVRQLRR